MRISTPGIVIRDYKHEDNRILTLLTDELGVVTAFANNANRMRSPLASSTELLCYSDFVLFKSKGKYFVDSADSKDTFFGIRSRIEDLSLGSYFVQLFEELSPKEEPAQPFVQLLLGGLHYLDRESRSHPLLKAVIELRLLTLAGYMPDLVGCRVCGNFESEKIYFSLNGDLVCSDCYGQSDPTGLREVSRSVLAAMRHIIYSEPKKLFAFTLLEQSFKQLANVSEGYLLFQIEKTLPTLEFYRSFRRE